MLIANSNKQITKNNTVKLDGHSEQLLLFSLSAYNLMLYKKI